MRRRDGLVEVVDRVARANEAVGLARRAADWILEEHSGESQDPSLYHGHAGVLLALEEAAEYFGDELYLRAVGAGADALATQAESLDDCSPCADRIAGTDLLSSGEQ